MFRTVACSSVRLTSHGSKATNCRTAANLKDIRNRIKAVGSIAKLTKTMQMVASSRLRAATARAEASSLMPQGPTKVLDSVEPDLEHGNNLIIAVVSDKGMCGSVHTQTAKFAKTLAEEDKSRHYLAAVGTKGVPPLAHEFQNEFLMSLKDVGKKELSFAEVSMAADQFIRAGSLDGGFDTFRIAYSHYKNVVTYIPTEITVNGLKHLTKNVNAFAPFTFDDHERLLLRDLQEFQFACSLWTAVNQTRNSELAARMTSMDNATKSAGKIISALTLSYNRGRQAAITTELVEITSGAAAVQEGK